MDVAARFASALVNLAERGVVCRLCPDTHVMQFDRRGLPEWLVAHLEDCRQSYTEAMRHAAGLCIRCGDDTAKRPQRNPGMPALWCASCFDRGAWENWASGGEIPLKGGPRARSEKTRAEDDALFAGIDGDGDGEPEADPAVASLFDGPADRA